MADYDIIIVIVVKKLDDCNHFKKNSYKDHFIVIIVQMDFQKID